MSLTTNVPRKASERISIGIRKYQPIIASARARDVGEADTVTIVKDMLADLFGYDKYSELTSEYSIRGTFCDLAIKVDGALQALIEVKPIGSPLKENHVKQAVDYAANQGVDWVLLTNGQNWRVYHVTFAKPITTELVIDIDFCNLNPKATNDIESLYLWCKEGWQKSVLGEYRDQRQALSRFFIGSLLTADPVLNVIRRELRRITPDAKINNEEIAAVLTQEVIKREVIEGDGASDARKKIACAAGRKLRAIGSDGEQETIPNQSAPPLPPAASSP